MASTIRIAILANGSQVNRELSGVDRRFKATISTVTNLGDKIRVGMKVGATAVAGLAIATGAGALKVVDYAAKLELMDRKARVVFGNTFPQMEAWAGKVGARMGLTTRQTLGMAAGIQDLLIPMGFTRDRAGQMTQKLAGLSGALAEWSGGTRSATEVGDILSAALLGERDALQGLGIGISQAQVDAQVLTNKKKGLTFATDEQAQAQATLDLILAKSTDAQKAYATGAGTLAARLGTAKAKLGNLRDELVTRATPALITAAAWIDRNKVNFQKFGLAVVEWSLKIGAAALAIVSVFASATAKILRFLASIVEALVHAVSATLGVLSHIPLIGDKFKAAQAKVDEFGRVTVAKLNGAATGADKVAASAANAARKAAGMSEAVRNIKDRLVRVTVVDGATSRLIAIRREVDALTGRAISIQVGSIGHGARANATGTRSAAQGWSWVGEQGPELVNFRGGERVIDAQSAKHAGDAAQPVNVTVVLDGVRQMVRAEMRERDRSTTAYVRARTA
jgi:hypothetical protein